MSAETPLSSAPESSAFDQVLRRVGSLKITIPLMAASIFLVLGGTLAQTSSSIEQVVDSIFRCWFCKIHVSWFLSDAFLDSRSEGTAKALKSFVIPWVGGLTLGLLFFCNLLAAHIFRWKISARGPRLAGGLFVFALGLGLSWLIVEGKFMDVIGYAFTSICSLFGHQTTLDDSFWRVLDRLAQGLLAAAVFWLALHLLYGRIKAGVVLIHSSVLLLLLAELVTHVQGVESNMTLREGETVSFIDRSTKYELAVIEDLPGGQAKVTVVPDALLQGKEAIDLPGCDLRLTPLTWWHNSDVMPSHPTAGATRGLGTQYQILPMDANGVKGQRTLPSCLVKLQRQNGEDLGSFAFSLMFYSNFSGRNAPDLYEELSVGQRHFRLMLRNEREYLRADAASEPVAITLNKFHMDRFMGAQTQMGYSSLVEVKDPALKTPEHIEIWMNHPLRRHGRTFYQAGVLSSGDGTILQVMQNGGWMIPYIACMVAGLGMFVHFFGVFLRFLRREREERKQVLSVSRRFLSLALISVLLLVGYTGYSITFGKRGPKAVYLDEAGKVPFISKAEIKTGRDINGFTREDLDAAGAMPVAHLGRIKPLDAVARHALTVLSQGSDFVDFDGQKRPAILWLLDVASGADLASEHRVFKITDLNVLKQFGLPERPGFVYSLAELSPKMAAYQKEVSLIDNSEKARRSDYQGELIALGNKLQLFNIVSSSFFRCTEMPADMAGFRAKVQQLKSNSDSPLIIPLLDSPDWESFPLSQVSPGADGKVAPVVQSWYKLLACHSLIRSLEQIRFRQAVTALPESERARELAQVKAPSRQELSFVSSSLASVMGPEARAKFIAEVAHVDGMPPEVRANFNKLDPDTQLEMLTSNQKMDDLMPKVLACLADDTKRIDVGQELSSAVAAVRTAASDAAAVHKVRITTRMAEIDAELPAVRQRVAAGKPEDLGAATAKLTALRTEKQTLDKQSEVWIRAPTVLPLESLFLRANLNLQCIIWYLTALVIALLGQLLWKPQMRIIALSLLWSTFALHTLALGLRIWISGYPPVTNLYASAVFIGWAVVLFGLIFEHRWRGNTLLAPTAFVGAQTLFIAYFLSLDGETMKQLMPVLDTRFWLATHVTCIALGYAATFLAGSIGLYWILLRLVRRQVEDERFRGALYGVTCFAIFFSLVGTVLGGLWADDSWGRFWGWDPKENGALMIVIWNAIVLHSQWGRFVDLRGMAVLVVFGNIVTAWSWFGVNLLGAGLHSYGFTKNGALNLGIFMISQLAVMVLAILVRTSPGKAEAK